MSFFKNLGWITEEFLRIVFRPRFAALLYIHYRLTPKGIVFADATTHKIVHANPIFLKGLGWKEYELRAKPFLSFVHAEDHEKTTKEMKRLSSGDVTVEFTNRYMKPDESFVKVKWTAAIVDGWYICEAEPSA